MPRRFRIAAAVLAVAVFATAGCSDDQEPPAEGEVTLPEGAALVTAAADEMAQIQTARITIEADADIADLPVRRADAQVTREGDAEGTAEIEQFGQLVELRFVLVGDAFHYQLVGPWLEIPRSDAEQLYDPSAILDPDRGVSNLLRNAQDPQVRQQTDLDGTAVYEVTATFAGSDLAALLPGVPDGVEGTLWIGVDRPLLHRAEFRPPGGTVTVNFAEFDAPADITAP